MSAMPHLRLILASQSPRRSDLLRRACFEFTTVSFQISEIPNESLNLPGQIQDLAWRKAQECLKLGKAPKGQGNLVLSADTVVVLDGQILGKPSDMSENQSFLQRLSGKTHSVITGVCLVEVDSGRSAVAHEISEITFRKLSTQEIHEYAVSGEGLDKAGGYGIQGGAAKFVERVEGSHDNIVGLPVALVEKLLRENGWRIDRK
jgi:septum formation protein